MDDLINRHTFDLSKSGCIVKYYGESKEGTELREWSYEKKGGIWIPKSFSLDHKKWSNSQTNSIKKRLFRKVNFLENTLNEPVPVSEFSLEKLGVTVGTRVSDHLLGLFYYYGGSEKFLLDDPNILVEESSSALPQAIIEANMESQQNNDEKLIVNEATIEQPNTSTLAETGQSNNTKLVLVIVITLLFLAGIVSFILMNKNGIKS